MLELLLDLIQNMFVHHQQALDIAQFAEIETGIVLFDSASSSARDCRRRVFLAVNLCQGERVVYASYGGADEVLPELQPCFGADQISRSQPFIGRQ
jgi:hypothetical protein